MQWATMATGASPLEHGIHGPLTVENGKATAISSGTRRAKAFWEILSEHHFRCGVIGWPGEAWPGGNAEMRVGMEDLDPRLLGLLLPDAAEITSADDPRPLQLMQQLANLYSIHNSAIHLTAEVDCLAVRYDFPVEVARLVPDHAVIQNACRLQDLLLGDLIRAAGPGTDILLISNSGILAAAGPHIVSRENLLRHADLHDIAPILLSLFQIPPENHFTPPAPEQIPLDARAASISRQNRWNLALALLSLGRPADALPHLERCHFDEPESAACAYQLALCRLQLNLLPEARNALATLEDAGSDQPVVRHFHIRLLLAAHQPEKAWQLWSAMPPPPAPFAEDHLRLKCQLLARLRRHAEAEQEIHNALQLHRPTQADLLGLAQVQLAMGKFDAAIATVQQALAVGKANAATHAVLAEAHDRSGRFREAAEAYSAWQRLQPEANFPKQRLTALAKTPPRPLPKRPDPGFLRREIAARLAIRDELRRQSGQRLHASASSDSSDWNLRTPSAAELPRLLANFPLRHVTGPASQWIVTTGRPSRIVSRFQIHSEGPTAILDFNIRPAWIAHPSTRVSLEAAIARAGPATIHTQTDPTGELAEILCQLGFQSKATRESWRLYIETGVRYLPRFLPALNRYPQATEPFSAKNLPAAAALCERLGLLSNSKVRVARPADPPSDAFDPRLSFVALKNGQVSAVVLARLIGPLLYLEVVAQHPDPAIAGPTAVLAVLRKTYQAAHALGIKEARCTIQPSLTRGLTRFLIKSGGTCSSRFAAFERPPGP